MQLAYLVFYRKKNPNHIKDNELISGSINDIVCPVEYLYELWYELYVVILLLLQFLLFMQN